MLAQIAVPAVSQWFGWARPRDDTGTTRQRLPSRVIPLEVHHIAALGLDLMLGSMALGAAQFVILAAGSEAPEYRAALARVLEDASDITTGLGYGGERFRLIEAREVKELEAALWDMPRWPLSRRQPSICSTRSARRSILPSITCCATRPPPRMNYRSGVAPPTDG